MRWLKLRNVEDRVDSLEVFGEPENVGVSTGSRDDFERSEVFVRKLF